jgi:hypothetical protein
MPREIRNQFGLFDIRLATGYRLAVVRIEQQ